ncbi:MAG: hypothetical protein JNK60_12460 [Acidobacteria bacterium]|nr:hypothetical protein [Acidobacteriota bacterium]
MNRLRVSSLLLGLTLLAPPLSAQLVRGFEARGLGAGEKPATSVLASRFLENGSLLTVLEGQPSELHAVTLDASGTETRRVLLTPDATGGVRRVALDARGTVFVARSFTSLTSDVRVDAIDSTTGESLWPSPVKLALPARPGGLVVHLAPFARSAGVSDVAVVVSLAVGAFVPGLVDVVTRLEGTTGRVQAGPTTVFVNGLEARVEDLAVDAAGDLWLAGSIALPGQSGSFVSRRRGDTLTEVFPALTFGAGNDYPSRRRVVVPGSGDALFAFDHQFGGTTVARIGRGGSVSWLRAGFQPAFDLLAADASGNAFLARGGSALEVLRLAAGNGFSTRLTVSSAAGFELAPLALVPAGGEVVVTALGRKDFQAHGLAARMDPELSKVSWKAETAPSLCECAGGRPALPDTLSLTGDTPLLSTDSGLLRLDLLDAATGIVRVERARGARLGVPAPLVLPSLVVIPDGDLALGTKEGEGYVLRRVRSRDGSPAAGPVAVSGPVAAAGDGGLYVVAEGALERRDALDLSLTWSAPLPEGKVAGVVAAPGRVYLLSRLTSISGSVVALPSAPGATSRVRGTAPSIVSAGWGPLPLAGTPTAWLAAPDGGLYAGVSKGSLGTASVLRLDPARGDVVFERAMPVAGAIARMRRLANGDLAVVVANQLLVSVVRVSGENGNVVFEKRIAQSTRGAVPDVADLVEMHGDLVLSGKDHALWAASIDGETGRSRWTASYVEPYVSERPAGLAIDGDHTVTILTSRFGEDGALGFVRIDAASGALVSRTTLRGPSPEALAVSGGDVFVAGATLARFTRTGAD